MAALQNSANRHYQLVAHFISAVAQTYLVVTSISNKHLIRVLVRHKAHLVRTLHQVRKHGVERKLPVPLHATR